MDPIAKSGYYNSNKFARIFLESIEEITGTHGLNAILNFAGLPEWVGQRPPDDLEPGFDFSSFSAVNRALEEIYGSRGGKGLALRIGKTTFSDMLSGYGSLAGVGDLDFKVLPLQAKIGFALKAMARIFSERSDLISHVVEEDDCYKYRIERCPVCWERTADKDPICFYFVGLLEGGLDWISGGKVFKISETRCSALGDEVCEFTILKQPVE